MNLDGNHILFLFLISYFYNKNFGDDKYIFEFFKIIKILLKL